MRLRCQLACVVLSALCSSQGGCGEAGGDGEEHTVRELHGPLAISCVHAGDRAYLVDRGQQSLLAIDRANGAIHVISAGFWTGTGPALGNPSALAVSADATNSFVVADQSLLQVNLLTGMRTLLRENMPLAFTDLPISALALSSDGARLFALDPQRGLLTLPVDGSNERVLSTLNASRGANATGFDVQGNTIWVSEYGGDALTALDANDGHVLRTLRPPLGLTPNDLVARADTLWVLGGGGGAGRGLWRVELDSERYTHVSGEGRGAGEPFGVPQTFCIADATNEAWVLDSIAGRLWIVDLTTGDRAALVEY